MRVGTSCLTCSSDRTSQSRWTWWVSSFSRASTSLVILVSTGLRFCIKDLGVILLIFFFSTYNMYLILVVYMLSLQYNRNFSIGYSIFLSIMLYIYTFNILVVYIMSLQYNRIYLQHYNERDNIFLSVLIFSHEVRIVLQIMTIMKIFCLPYQM